MAARERMNFILKFFMIGCIALLNSVDGNSLPRLYIPFHQSQTSFYT